MTEREQQDAYRRRASTLGANLALAREAAGLTQGDLADRAGTSRATIAQIESGEGDPRLSTLGAIADALSVGTFVLLLGKQDIGKLVALAQKQKELAAAVPNAEDVVLLDELSASHLAADRRRAARMSSDIASERGFDGVGAAVGAAIGTTLMPGLGTIVGAFLGAVGARKKKGRTGNEEG
jgi:transcriptional regulator with XRE-family HTH domain